MKHKINLAAAADAESFGALAIGRRQFRRRQTAAAPGLIRYVFRIVREAGAEKHWVRAGRLSLRLREKGKQQMLVIQG